MKVEISEKLKGKLSVIRSKLLNGERLFDFAKRHSYPLTTVDLLSNQVLSKPTEDMINTQLSQTQTSHLKDDRNIFEYDMNLIAGWVVEDYIVENTFGVFKLNGSDKKRNILISEITNLSDFKNIVNNKDTELHTEYFIRNNNQKILLRDNKYKHLLEAKAQILIVNIPSRTFLIKDVSDFTTEFIPNYEYYGGKDVYALSLQDIDKQFKPLDYLFRYCENLHINK